MGKNSSILVIDPEHLDHIPGGYDMKMLVDWEIHQAKGDGRDPLALARLEKRSQTEDRKKLLDIYEHVLNLPVDKKFPYEEPDDLESILKLRPSAKMREYEISPGDEWLFDRLYGAWLGRCAGCTLGGPGETFRPDTRRRLIEYLTAVSPDEWPIRDYIPENSPCGHKFHWKLDATRERLQYVPADDDLTHTIIAQIMLREIDHPLSFRTIDLASAWFRFLPYDVTAGGTAMLAYRNLVIRYPMRKVSKKRESLTVDWNWVATYCNPFREDLDASLRADSYGYAAPGMPELAANLAWRDARLSNIKNGIYCSMFYAAMIASAFALDDPLQIVQAGLKEIPETSRLYEAVGKVIDICQKHEFQGKHIDQVHDDIYKTFGDDHNGTENNMALVVSGLLMGQRDFGKIIAYTVMGGWDCDTTGASAGSIAGAMLGAKNLPEKWISPLRDTLHGQVVGYDPISVSECARRSVEIAQKVLDKNSYPK